ncbi:MAG: hypothetical protein ABFS37_16225, partial [Acidobacteriota bacterium]
IGLWRQAAARLSLAERRASIAVALHDEDLVAAARWSIGGGVLLPPSLMRVSAACRAANEASNAPLWIGDPAAVSEMGRSRNRLSVSLQPQRLWEAMVGLRGCLEALTALAAALEQPAVMGQGPALTLTGLNRAEIETAWEGLDCRPPWAGDGGFLVFGEPEPEAASGVGTPVFEIRKRPVAQWPTGRVVAGWSLDPSDLTCPWRLQACDGSALAADGVSTLNDLGQATTDIIRVEGIPSSDLDREGSPGAVVVEALAREADRSGKTLWIPGVSHVAGAIFRRWGLSVWVDGPVLG